MKKLIYTALVLASCSQPRTPNRDYGGLNAVNDLKGNTMAGAAVAAQTDTENGRVPGACLDLLLADGKDVYINELGDESYDRGRNLYCSMTESSQISILKESIKSRHNANKDFRNTIDVIIKSVPVRNDLNYSQHDASSYDDDMAKLDASRLTSVLCTDRSRDEYRSLAQNQIQSTVSPVTLDKYNACVMAKSYGLKCSVEQNGQDIKATIRWEPTELVRSFLPVVALSIHSITGVSVDGKAPETVGVGSGVIVPFKINDSSQFNAAIFSANGFDRSGTYSFACKASFNKTRAEAPEVKRVFGPHPTCEVKDYKLGTGEICGPKQYKSLRTEACGVEQYRAERGPGCGVELYNNRHDCGVCGQAGAFGGCKQCRNPLFGVERYNECRRVDFGVELYRECRLASNGVEAWDTCRNPAFGVETYHSCLHIDDGR